MKRVLITGMSGTGKSTLMCMLAERGYKAVETDGDEWLRLVESDPSASTREQDWVWREDRMQELLSTEDADILFVSGCRSNQGKFYAQFDNVILLSAPVDLMVERLATRTNNPYGKCPDELALILQQVQSVEPKLRATASLEIDTSVPVDQVVKSVLEHVRPSTERL